MTTPGSGARWPGRPAWPRALEDLAAVQHSADPAWYAATYRRRVHDVAFYVARAAEAGRVLELGCGDGRITLPLARSGAHVHAIDRVPAMVDALRTRLARAPAAVRSRVTTAVADLRAVEVPDPFPLVICPFNTFLHLYTRQDVARALDAVRAALAPGGLFLFDVSLPRPGDLRDRRARGRTVRRGGRAFRYVEEFHWEALEQILYVTMTWTPVDGGAPVTQLLAHRQFFPAELEALLAANGFALVEASAWGEPPDADPDALVVGCRPA